MIRIVHRVLARPLFFVAILIVMSVVIIPNSAEALTWGGSLWRQMAPITVTFFVEGDCYYVPVLDYYGNPTGSYYGPICDPGRWESHSLTAFDIPGTLLWNYHGPNRWLWYAGGRAYLTNTPPKAHEYFLRANLLGYKPVQCAANELLTGASLYMWSPGVDEEHVNALCTGISGSGISVGGGSWVTAPNAWANIIGYKTAVCPAGQIATGVRMYVRWNYVDDEHVDIYCSSVNGVTVGAPLSWIQPHGAWSAMHPGHKTAVCPAGHAVVGAQWFQWHFAMDEEHVNVLCAPVTATAISPTATLSASPNPVQYGGRSTLTWSSTNATSCTAGGPWSNSGMLSGSGLTDPLISNTTFTFQCTGPGGTSTLQSITVNVLPPPPPECSVLNTNPSDINAGGTVTLTWACQNATSCVEVANADGFSTGGSTSGSDNTVTPSIQSGSVTYGLTCTGASTRTFNFPPVRVHSPDASITALPTRVASPGTTNISWSSTNMSSCEVRRNGISWQSGLNSPPGGVSDTINTRTTYVLTCAPIVAGPPFTRSVTVNVMPQFWEF